MVDKFRNHTVDSYYGDDHARRRLGLDHERLKKYRCSPIYRQQLLWNHVGSHITCVVFKRTLEHVKDRLRSYLRYNVPSITFDFFGSTIISEVEGLADVPSESSQTFKGCEHVDTPFAIVYVDPSNPNGLVKDDDKDFAVNYLKGIIKQDEVFYCDEAEEAAIHAFPLLYNQKFEPDDIWVHVVILGEEENLRRNDIKRYLDVINKPDSSGGDVSGSAPEKELLVMLKALYSKTSLISLSKGYQQALYSKPSLIPLSKSYQQALYL